MNRWLIAAAGSLALAACDGNRIVTEPERSSPTPAVTTADAAIYIVNFDETQTTRAAVTTGVLNSGAGIVQFNNFSMVAALATPAQLVSISALPGLEGIHANKQLEYSMLHESVPAIRADAVHAAGITGRGIGVAILDSGIDGLYNADVAYPAYTVQNVNGRKRGPRTEHVESVQRRAMGDQCRGNVQGYHPDISAPGVHIVSTRASTGTVLNALDLNHDARICNISLLNQAFYTCASGTSMASPHIAGVVALMQEAAGGRLSPTQVLNALTSTARPLPGYATWEVGAGFVDAYAAVMKVKR